MERWTSEQRAFAVKAYYKSGDSVIGAQRAFRRQFHLNARASVPTANAITLWAKNFESTGNVLQKRGGSEKTSRTPENIERVRVALTRSPRKSARRHSLELGLSNRTLRRILKNDLKFHPYKMQIVQHLKPQDYNNRVRFCEQMLNVIEQDEDRIHNLWMSDEAHFHLSGFVNKQNFRYWSESNPKNLHEKPLHSPKVTVWCAMSSLGIIGPFFFEDDLGYTVTVNSDRYADMLATFFFPRLDGFNPDDNTLFQQDGATSHTAIVSMDLLKLAFPGCLISRNGDFPWPARSPDLTAPDFFLWGYLKAKVFKENPPRTTDDLKNRIRQEVTNIPLEMLRDVMGNFVLRLRQCVENNGRHLTDVIFKK